MYIMMFVITSALISFVPSGPVKPMTSKFKYYGDIAPAGYFDPLKIANKENSKYLREAELQHGRVAMLASVLIPVFEMMNSNKLGINFLSDMDFNSQLPFWYGMACLEFYRMYNGWNSPFYGENRMPFSLTEDYQPGNLFSVKSDNITERRYNSELSNGRLAMLAAAHMIASELATGETIAQQLSHF